MQQTKNKNKFNRQSDDIKVMKKSNNLNIWFWLGFQIFNDHQGLIL